MIGFVQMKQKGLTLVELLVSITISLIIMAGVVQLYFTSSQTQRSQEGVARIQENMRYLFGKLEEDVSQTGYMGCIPFEGGGGGGATIQNLLSKTLGGTLDFDNMISGKDNSGVNGSDQLELRFFSATNSFPLGGNGLQSTSDPIPLDIVNFPDSYKAFDQYDIALISDCSFGAVFMITNVPDATGMIAHDSVTSDPNDGQSNTSNGFDRFYGTSKSGASTGSQAFLFSGSLSSSVVWALGDSAAGTAAGVACSAAAPQYCALLRNDEELAEGVQDFQLQYGWLNAAGNLRVGDASQVSDWNEVDRVIVSLTLNSVLYAPTNDGQPLTTKVVSKTIMLRNQVPGSYL